MPKTRRHRQKQHWPQYSAQNLKYLKLIWNDILDQEFATNVREDLEERVRSEIGGNYDAQIQVMKIGRFKHKKVYFVINNNSYEINQHRINGISEVIPLLLNYYDYSDCGGVIYIPAQEC